MRYVNGRVFKDPTLPGLCPQERGIVYRATAQVLAAIHSVDIQKTNLIDFGKTGTTYDLYIIIIIINNLK